MKNIRRSIRYKVQRLTACTVAVALAASACVSLSGMLNMRKIVQSNAVSLCDSAGEQVRQTLTYQMEENALELVRSKAALADEWLEQFSNWAEMLTRNAQIMYATRDSSIETLLPDSSSDSTITMQYALAGSTVKAEDLSEEICLLGTLENAFAPIMNTHTDRISMLSIGTESGILMSCSTGPVLSSTVAEEEDCNYFSSEWYKQAQDATGPFFTDACLDSHDCGLTLSCVAPIRNGNGAFLGAVGIDILMSGISDDIIDIKIGTGSYAVLLDRNGNILVSSAAQTESGSKNLYADGDLSPQDVDKMLSGSTGVIKGGNGMYYAYTPITSAAWTLAVSIPESSVLSTANAVQGLIIGSTRNTIQAMDREIFYAMLFLVAVLCTVLSAALFSANSLAKTLTKPIIHLRRDVDEISRGNFSHRSTVQADNEIGMLVKSFNEMLPTVQRNIATLTEGASEKEPHQSGA